MSPKGQLDLKNHDPNNINGHLKIAFQDVLGEPRSVHSCGPLWQGSQCCFQFFFSIVYGLLVCLNHLCLSAYWGAEFGLLAYLHVWYITPCTRVSELIMRVPAFLCRTCTRCLVDPWCEAASYLFMFFGHPSADGPDGDPMSMY